MASPTKDTERGNIHTGLLLVKIRIDNDNVVAIPNAHLIECFFIEDIFSTCMVGKLVFTDDQGIYEYGPFTGNETVSFVYGREQSREVVFHIMKVEKIVPSTQTSSQVAPIVSLHIVDTTYEYFTSYRYSRSFEKNLKHTDIAKHIIKNMVGWNDDKYLNILPSTSEEKKPFIMPYWTPKDTIDFVLTSAYRNDFGGYLCYNNTMKRQSINIQPLSYLLSSTTPTDNVVYELETTGSEQDPKTLKNKILDWWIDGIDHSTTRGIRNVKYYGYDIATKKMYTQNLTYDTGIKFTPILGKHTLFEDNYVGDDKAITGVNFINAQNNELNLRKFGINDFVHQYSLQQLVNVIVTGNEKRYAGHQILVDWGSIDQTSRTKNKLFDGAYLVKSITHDFVNRKMPVPYTQRMTLIKNGFQSPSTRLLKKSTNVNITGGVKTTEFNTP